MSNKVIGVVFEFANVRRQIPRKHRTCYVSADGKDAFLSAALFGSPMEMALCAMADGALIVQTKDAVYVSLNWIQRDMPRAAKVITPQLLEKVEIARRIALEEAG